MSFLMSGLSCMQSGVVRNLSLLFGVSLSVFILIWPQHIARDLDQLEHGNLSLLMAFMCLLFVHGVGLRFRSRVMQWLISPLLLWPLAALLLFLTLQN
jgi:predicted membrane protein